MKRNKIWIAFILVIVVGSQLIPAKLPDVKSDNSGDIIKSGIVPSDVAALLRKACYDCHSNETVYPWYSYVAPVLWLVIRDVNEGREELNFSEWDKLEVSKKGKKLEEIADEVPEGEMPMFIYPLMHKDAKLSGADRKLIAGWASQTADKLFGKQ